MAQKFRKLKLINLGEGMSKRKNVEDGNKIMAENIQENPKKVEEEIKTARKHWEDNQKNKYFVFGILLFIGIILGIELPSLYNILFRSKFSRESLDQFMYGKLGHYGFQNVTTQELLVVSYEYNSQEPRFFSKYFEH